MSIKRWIRDWLNSDGPKLINRAIEADVSPEQGTQISIAEAINGRVLTIRTYRPNNAQYASNWTNELYVLKDEESLPEAITMLLLLKGLK
jgi:hypothetical protein